MKKATIIEKSINELKEYDKNPRKNNGAVDYVANSIKEFGFKVPIIIDKNGTIVCGHTRYKAAKKLKLSTVPCIVADLFHFAIKKQTFSILKDLIIALIIK